MLIQTSMKFNRWCEWENVNKIHGGSHLQFSGCHKKIRRACWVRLMAHLLQHPILRTWSWHRLEEWKWSDADLSFSPSSKSLIEGFPAQSQRQNCWKILTHSLSDNSAEDHTRPLNLWLRSRPGGEQQQQDSSSLPSCTTGITLLSSS